MSKTIEEIFKRSFSKSDVCRNLNLSINGNGIREVNKLILDFNINIDHFDRGASKKTKWEIIDKQCPVCNNYFEAKLGHPKEKMTCSYGCSNAYFRSDENNGGYKDGSRKSYRQLCFRKYDFKCLICGWDTFVDVHHVDFNRKNNVIFNLVPLCPNHHKMAHMNKHKEEILLQIKEKIKQFDLTIRFKSDC